MTKRKQREKERKRESEREREREKYIRVSVPRTPLYIVGSVSAILSVFTLKTRGRTILCARMPEAFDLKRDSKSPGKTDF